MVKFIIKKHRQWHENQRGLASIEEEQQKAIEELSVENGQEEDEDMDEEETDMLRRTAKDRRTQSRHTHVARTSDRKA